MGSGQSARKLTVNNEDVDVIKVSNALVHRLTQGAEDITSEPAAEVRPVTLAEPTSTKAMSPQPPQSGDGQPATGYPVYYYPELTLSALQIQQQKEKELLNQDNYWQKRVQNLEKAHFKINRIIEEEYKKAAEELYTNGQKVINIQDTVQPCMESTTKVLKCYQEYPKEILKCSNLVEEFSNCVDQRRARVIAARC